MSNNNIKGSYVGIYFYNTNNNNITGNNFMANGVGIAKCNAIDDTITNTNTFKDSYLADTSIVETGEYTLATTIYTCGPAAFATVYNHLGGYTNEGEIAQLAGTDETGTNLQGLKKAADKKGIKDVIGAKNVDINQLKPYYILVLNIDDTNHFVVYLNKTTDTVTVFDPNLGIIFMNMTQFRTFYKAGGQTVFILNSTTLPVGATAVTQKEMEDTKALWHTITLRGGYWDAGYSYKTSAITRTTKTITVNYRKFVLTGWSWGIIPLGYWTNAVWTYTIPWLSITTVVHYVPPKWHPTITISVPDININLYNSMPKTIDHLWTRGMTVFNVASMAFGAGEVVGIARILLKAPKISKALTFRRAGGIVFGGRGVWDEGQKMVSDEAHETYEAFNDPLVEIDCENQKLYLDILPWNIKSKLIPT